MIVPNLVGDPHLREALYKGHEEVFQARHQHRYKDDRLLDLCKTKIGITILKVVFAVNFQTVSYIPWTKEL
jgi:hypothetical protein